MNDKQQFANDNNVGHKEITKKPRKQNNIICDYCNKIIKVREGVNVHYTQWQDYYPFQSFYVNPYRIEKEKRKIKIYCCRCDRFTVREEVRIKESKGAAE